MDTRKKEKPRVSIIIATYNEAKFVHRCLENLRELGLRSSIPFEVIVKDQASTDGTPSLVEEYPEFHLIQGGNEGLARAYNIAFQHVSPESEYLLFLGMDAFPEQGALEELVNYLDSRQDVGAATCKLVTADGSLDMDAHRAFPTPWISLTKFLGLNKMFPKSDFFNHYFLPNKDMTQPHEIDMCISHFLFVRRSVFEQLGGFDEDYFLYGEDVDLCYRIKQAGWKIMYLPQCRARHLKGGSVGVRKTTRSEVKKPLKHRLKMQRLSTQAMETFLRKHYMDKYPRFLVHLMIYSSRLLGGIRVFLETFR